jgi:hypothetical protein
MRVRPAAVSGSFYPAEATVLRDLVDSILSKAQTEQLDPPPKALIVPHAGYIYSGLTAAYAYQQLFSVRKIIKRVVLLGPVHRVAVNGLALPEAEVFTTPLGDVILDQLSIEKIRNMPQVLVSAAAHAQEHSLEVQLPFLQTVLDDFQLIPLAVGDISPAMVAQVLEELWGDEQTLIVISSDLSHFHNYSDATLIDQQSIDQILAHEPQLNHQQACGATGINALLLKSSQHNLQPILLDYRNSGDTSGDKSSVVGYASVAFSEDKTHESR